MGVLKFGMKKTKSGKNLGGYQKFGRKKNGKHLVVCVILVWFRKIQHAFLGPLPPSCWNFPLHIWQIATFFCCERGCVLRSCAVLARLCLHMSCRNAHTSNDYPFFFGVCFSKNASKGDIFSRVQFRLSPNNQDNRDITGFGDPYRYDEQRT